MINETQKSCLILLGQFKFLTLSQLLYLLPEMKYKNLWKQMNSLVKSRRGLAAKKKFDQITRIGKVEDLYFLTSKGARFLENEELIDVVKYPKGNISGKDYKHRKSILDFQILIADYAQSNKIVINRFLRYFDGVEGPERSAATQLESKRTRAIADAVFKISSNLFVIEVHNGKSAKRALKQIHQHAELLTSLAVHKKFEIPFNKAYRILFLFENSGTLNSTITRLQEEANIFHPVEKFILFKNLESLQEQDWTQNWLTIFGNPYSIKLK